MKKLFLYVYVCSAVCEVCGKNISRAGDMLKHRQTLTCRTNLRDSLVQGSSRLVVKLAEQRRSWWCLLRA